MISTLAQRSAFVKDVMTVNTKAYPSMSISTPFLKEALVSIARTYWWSGIFVGAGAVSGVVYLCYRAYKAKEVSEKETPYEKFMNQPFEDKENA